MSLASDDMRGLFTIVKGGYVKGAEPSFVNRESGDVSYVGGYDPERAQEWYMAMDRKCFHCFSCGSDYDKVLNSIRTVMKKYKGSAKRYFKHVCSVTSDDYYEVHYLGHTPLTPEKRAKKAEGRCPRTSPIMRCLYEEIDKHYGDYYSDDIEKIEEEVYRELVDEKPVNKSRKIVQRVKKNLGIITPVSTSAKEVKNEVKRPVLKKPEKHEVVTPKYQKPVVRKVKLLR